MKRERGVRDIISALFITVLYFFRFTHFAPAGAQFRRALYGVVGPLGKAPAEYVAGILHDHEGKGIQLFHQLFDLGHLGQFDHAEQQFPVLVGVGPFPFDVGDAAAYDFDDGFRDFFVVVADDDNIFFEVKAVGKGVVYRAGSSPKKKAPAVSSTMLIRKPVVPMLML